MKVCLERGLICNPFIVVVGTDLTDDQQSYYYIYANEDTAYRCSSFFGAVESLLHIYLTLSIDYPFESESICLFIQRGFFGLS